jgi:hypothetical protein
MMNSFFSKIRIYGRKAAQQKGLLKFARDVAKGSLDFFENEYFDSSLRAIPPKIGKFTLLLRKVFTK